MIVAIEKAEGSKGECYHITAEKTFCNKYVLVFREGYFLRCAHD